MLFKLDSAKPELVGEGHFIAETAAVIGQVKLGARSSVWFSAVIRADVDAVDIGEDTNIQDGAVLHVDPGYPLRIGNGVTVGHQAMLHGCEIGDNTLIGINAVVLNGARIGSNCLIGANALVTENMEVPDGSVVMGSPAKIVKQLAEDKYQVLSAGAKDYVEKAQLFSRELEKVEQE